MTAAYALEFANDRALMRAIARLRAEGWTRLEAHTPYPVHGLEEALDLPRSPVSRNTLLGGLAGAMIGYGLQWWTNAVDYPLIVGGRPAHAAPAFVLITFETAVLFAAFAALLSVFWYAGLPALWHQVFEIEGFESASIDRFWLIVDATDPKWDEARFVDLAAELGASRTVPVGETP